MTCSARLDLIGTALAHASRGHMLCALMDGRAFTNKELAFAAGISPQTASAHLKVLQHAGLTTALRSGRHVYHRIKNEEVAFALERLACLTPIDHMQRAPKASQEMRAARSCYNHFAGRLGIALVEGLTARDVVRRTADGFVAGPNLPQLLNRLGLPSKLATPGAVLARPCLDWTERRDHMAGPLGTALLDLALERRWLIRPAQGRALHLTSEGRTAFAEVLGVSGTALSTHAPVTAR